MEPESFREVSIYLNQLIGMIIDVRKEQEENRTELTSDIARLETSLTMSIDKLKEAMDKEREAREALKTQRTFLIISAFIGPIIVSFFVAATGIGLH
jgi:predicted  nucleic acid-binding Zn-ribbon protein